MKDKLKELQDEFYQIFDNLNEARPVLKGVDEAFNCFAQDILEAYKGEVRLLKEEEIIRKERESYKLYRKRAMLTPHEWRNWKRFFKKEQNLAQTLLDEEVDFDTEQFFANSMKKYRGKEIEEEKEEKKPELPERGNEESFEVVQRKATNAILEAQRLITAYVAKLGTPSVNEQTKTEEEEPSENPEDEEEIEVENFDDYGIDTEYEILEETAQDVQESAETPENGQADSDGDAVSAKKSAEANPNDREAANGQDGADKRENGLVTGEANEAGQVLSTTEEKASEGIQGDQIEQEKGGTECS